MSENAQSEASSTAPNEMSEHERLASLVHAFISMMRAGDLAQMDLEYRDLKLSLRANADASVPQFVAVPQSMMQGNQPQSTAAATATAAATPDNEHVITAPMIGTFYVASAPSAPPFVQQGDRVEEGQTIGIIEAMKIMNEIAADRSGVVVEVVAKNSQSVEYGSPLIRLRPDPA